MLMFNLQFFSPTLNVFKLNTPDQNLIMKRHLSRFNDFVCEVLQGEGLSLYKMNKTVGVGWRGNP